MRKSNLIIIPLLFFLVLVCSCTNIERLYEKGNYRAVVDNVSKKKSPGNDDLLLQTKAYVNLGEENKALESALLYLLSNDGKSEQGRAYAVQVFLDTNTSDWITALVLTKDDGLEARKALYRAYSNQGDYQNAVQMMGILSAEMDTGNYISMILDNPISDERILEAFMNWFDGIGDDELDIFLSLLNRFSSEVTISEPVAWKFLSMTDKLVANEYFSSDNKKMSTVLKIKGNILESLFDKVNARSYWTQAYNLNPEDEELKSKIK